MEFKDTEYAQMGNSSMSVDETIDRLLENPDIMEFIHKYDPNHDVMVRFVAVFLDYIDDKDEEGFSKRYPGFIPELSYEENLVKINYKRVKKPQETRIVSFATPHETLIASLDDFSLITQGRRNLYQYARSFINSFANGHPTKGLYITGAFRSGKTYFAAAVGNELANKGYNVCMVYYPELSSTLKSHLDDERFNQIVDELKDAALLILDDFGGEAPSPFIRDEVLGVVLQYRMLRNKPIIITSNVPMARLADTSLRRDGSEGEMIKATRIVERIKELTTEFGLFDRYDKISNNQF